MKRLFSNWQGLTALLLAAAAFYFSPALLRLLDPTAGAFDVGYLQRPLVAMSYFFFATFCAWTAFQIDFPSLDKWIDTKGFEACWKAARGEFKLSFVFGVIALLVLAYLVCLWLVPV